MLKMKHARMEMKAWNQHKIQKLSFLQLKGNHKMVIHALKVL